MARSIPPDRLPAVIDAAVTVFVTHGFRGIGNNELGQAEVRRNFERR